jgi:dephospho-CoA kinase
VADIEIHNDGTLEQLRSEVDAIWARLSAGA